MQLVHGVLPQLLFEILKTYFWHSKDSEYMIFEYMDVEWILGGYCHQNLHQKNFPYYDK